MADNPFDALEKLCALLGEKVREIGLEQITFQPVIDPTTGQRLISAMFVLDEPIANQPALVGAGGPEPADPIDPETDAILSGILEATQEDERQSLHSLQEAKLAEQMEERRKAAEAMRDRLRDPGKGFLDDDD